MAYDKKKRQLIIDGARFGGWGFVLVIFSFLFSYAGYLLDKKLNTAPVFMIGLLFVAVSLCIIRLCQEALRECHYLEEDCKKGGIKDG